MCSSLQYLIPSVLSWSAADGSFFMDIRSHVRHPSSNSLFFQNDYCKPIMTKEPAVGRLKGHLLALRAPQRGDAEPCPQSALCPDGGRETRTWPSAEQWEKFVREKKDLRNNYISSHGQPKWKLKRWLSLSPDKSCRVKEKRQRKLAKFT